MNYKELRQLHRISGPQKTGEYIQEQFDSGKLKSSDFCLADVAEAFLGFEFVAQAGRPGRKPSTIFSDRRLQEAGSGTDSTAFLDISGQIIINAMMEQFALVEAIASRLVRTIPTRLKDGEKMPGVTWKNTDDDGIDTDDVKEGMPYPRLGLTQKYIETPPPIKYGRIMPVTKEAVFFDRTGQVLDQAGKVGEYLALKKEKLLMDAIVGYGGGSTPAFTHGGKWKYNGTEFAVYETNTVDFSSYFYINQITDVLTDHTDITAAMIKYSDLRDPNTREPIAINSPLTLLVPPALEQVARRIANASELRYTSGTETTIYDNPYKGMFTAIPSQYMLRRLIDGGSVSGANAAKHWLLGDFSKGFAWMECWDITPSTSPTNSTMEFEQDIIFEAKASMMGTPAVIAPQYVLRSTGAG
jgi:hypothetical protein